MGHPPPVLGDHRVGFGRFDLALDRVVLVAPDQLVHVAVQGRREQPCLAFRRGLVDETADLGEKTHVGHAVGLVDHHQVDAVQTQEPLVHQIGEPPRAGHRDVHAPAQCLDLRFDAGAAIEGVGPHVTGRTQPFEVAADLGGELAGRHEHQRTRPLRAGALHPGNQGHTEGQRLAASGRGSPAHVTTLERRGDRRLLDRKGSGDGAGVERVAQVVGHAEVGKGWHWWEVFGRGCGCRLMPADRWWPVRICCATARTHHPIEWPVIGSSAATQHPRAYRAGGENLETCRESVTTLRPTAGRPGARSGTRQWERRCTRSPPC